MNKLVVNNKKKYVKPQMECYVINNPCLLLASSKEEIPEYSGELG